MEARKQEELAFHNKLRGLYELDPEQYAHFTSNKKFYSITRKSKNYILDWVIDSCRGKRVLEYGCGGMPFNPAVDDVAKSVARIDISDESVRICRKRAGENPNRVAADVYSQMDCENMGFAADSFDVIIVSGVLHHLDVRKAYPELARVLHPKGRIICIEALGHNPLFQLYRNRTPHLRTKWEAEHILDIALIKFARKYFEGSEMKFFHLFSLAAVPFRNKPIFKPILSCLEALDSVVLSLPILRDQAWQVVFILSRPR